jgi:hypothetical protein
LFSSFIFSTFVKKFISMKVNGLNETLSYCLYVCDDEVLKLELYNGDKLIEETSTNFQGPRNFN